MPAGPAREPPRDRIPRGAVANAGFQRGPSPIDQIVAYMLLDRCPATSSYRGAPRPLRLSAKLDRGAGYLLFVQRAVAGQPLDDSAVVIAAGKAHLRVDAGRILRQGMLHPTLALHELFPVQHCQIAETKNAMLHRQFVSRLVRAGSGERGAGSRESDSKLQAPSSKLLRHAAEVVDEAQS